MSESLTSALFRSAEDLGPYLEDWEALAERESRPLSLPAWALSWWRNLRPEDSTLSVVLCWREGSLVGVVPLYSVGRRYMPLASGMPAAEPLARGGMEEGVAAQAAIRLAEADPPPASIELDLCESSPSWATLLAEAWPVKGGAMAQTKIETPVPRANIVDGFDDWMSSRSKGFRREMKRKRRRLERAGCSFRYASPETLEEDIGAFLELHRQRLAERGGTNLGDGVEQMLLSAGPALLESGHLKVLCTILEGRQISAEVMLVSGDELLLWSGGFDDDYAELSPGMQGMLRAISDASDEGQRAVNLGPGGQPYKYRLSDEEDSLVTHVVTPPGTGRSLTRLRVAAERLHHRLVPAVRSALGRLRQRWR